jgi:hypothetical protein
VIGVDLMAFNEEFQPALLACFRPNDKLSRAG